MTRIELDVKLLDKQLGAALNAFGLEFAEKLADAAPADTGELRSAIRNGWTVEKKGNEWHVTFNMPFYAKFIEFGTGIYGPFGQPIQPVSKKALAWDAGVKFRGKYGKMHEYQGSENWYAFKWVRGMLPNPFITRTFHQHGTKLLAKNLRRFVGA